MSRENTPSSRTAPAGTEPQSEGSAYVPARGAGLPVGYLQHYGIGKSPEPQGAIQLRGAGEPAITSAQMHEVAAQGVSGSGGALPHADRIQASFGHHDVSSVQAHTGTQASQAAGAMGAQAYATGNHVAFAGSPDLHTAAHEAAHVVQQRGGVQLKGGVGSVGDVYEQHADAVADRVVQGKSAVDLLDTMAPAGASAPSGGVQHKALQLDIKADLKKAMDGWGTDEGAIFARLQRATTAELNSVLADAALMRQIKSELSGSDLKRAYDLLPLPLPQKLRYAIEGWGTDEQYIWDSIARASIAELKSVARDTTLMGEVDADLSRGEQNRFRADMARRIFREGADADAALTLLLTSNAALQSQRLAAYGSVADQRALFDGVIMQGVDLPRAIKAFELYWNVTVGTNGASWNFELLQQVHIQCKHLPEQDVRAGRWKQLTVEGGSGGSFSAASDPSGNFNIGAQAGDAGQRTTLSAAAAVGATQITVTNPAALGVGAWIAIGPVASPEYKQISSIDTPNKRYTLNSALASAHAVGEAVATWNRASTGTTLTTAAASGAREIVVSSTAGFGAGGTITMGDQYPSPDVKRIASVDAANNKLVLTSQLSQAYAVGAKVKPEFTQEYGVGTSLSSDAAAGATDVFVVDPAVFAVGATIAFGPRPSADVKQITAVDAGAKKYTINSALTAAYRAGTNVTPDDATAARDINWVAATVRHEIGHAVDNVIGASGFYSLGGWWAGTGSHNADFDTWAGAMGTPWQNAVSSAPPPAGGAPAAGGAAPAPAGPAAGTTPITPADQALVKAAIVNGLTTMNAGGNLLTTVAATHPLAVNYNNNVPVIEAAKVSCNGGQGYWNSPENVKKYGSRYFAMNMYYPNFQYYNEQVQTQRVRSYQIFSPAEFFAEIYTVYYEEAGRVPNTDLGRLVPVASWRNWITTNVHNRGHAPTTTSPTGSSVGKKGGNPGRTT